MLFRLIAKITLIAYCYNFLFLTAIAMDGGVVDSKPHFSGLSFKAKPLMEDQKGDSEALGFNLEFCEAISQSSTKASASLNEDSGSDDETLSILSSSSKKSILPMEQKITPEVLQGLIDKTAWQNNFQGYGSSWDASGFTLEMENYCLHWDWYGRLHITAI